MAEMNEREPQAVASQVKAQLRRGEDPVEAVQSALGGQGSAAAQTGAQAGTQAGAQAGEQGEGMGDMSESASELADDASDQADDAGDLVTGSVEQTGDAVRGAADTAQGLGSRMMNAARGLAMEVSETLFGDREEKESR